jgi:Integrase zinc binding domain
LVLGRYLETLERPEGMDERYQQLRKKISQLFRSGWISVQKITQTGTAATTGYWAGTQDGGNFGSYTMKRDTAVDKIPFNMLTRRYQWKGMYDDVVEYVKSCEECQKWVRIRYEEPLYPTWSIIVWEKLGVDIVTMPLSKSGKNTLYLQGAILVVGLKGDHWQERILNRWQSFCMRMSFVVMVVLSELSWMEDLKTNWKRPICLNGIE